eukprot:jgi/Bigna1/79431/fgenesh1_pg.62_\
MPLTKRGLPPLQLSVSPSRLHRQIPKSGLRSLPTSPKTARVSMKTTSSSFPNLESQRLRESSSDELHVTNVPLKRSCSPTLIPDENSNLVTRFQSNRLQGRGRYFPNAAGRGMETFRRKTLQRLRKKAAMNNAIIKQKKKDQRKILEEKCRREADIKRSRKAAIARVKKWERELNRLERKAKIAASKEYKRGKDVDVEKFRKFCAAPTTPRSKKDLKNIAIIGGGPVGLWIGLLILQKYSRRRIGNDVAPELTRPYVTVFEKRDDESYMSRTFTLAIKSWTDKLINRYLLQPETFAPVCSLNKLEKALRTAFEQHGGRMEFKEIHDPNELCANGFDYIFWCGGRRSLSPSVRSQLNMEQIEGHFEEVMLLDFTQHERVRRPVNDVLTSGFNAQKPGLRVMLRPGDSLLEGHIWVFGVSTEIAAACNHSCIAGKEFESINKCLMEVFEVCNEEGNKKETMSSSQETLENLLASYEAILVPVKVRIHSTRAAFFHSKTIFSMLDKADGSKIPFVLAGDAAYGKPFWTGSTLNHHLLDVHQELSKLKIDRNHQDGMFKGFIEQNTFRTSTPGFDTRKEKPKFVYEK